MGRPTPAAERAERAAVANVAREVAALGEMTGSQLAARFEELFGFPARTRNRVYLRKRLAFRIQELAEGGLSDAALKRIEELREFFPAKWRQVLEPTRPVAPADIPCRGDTGARDPRLPAPGTVVTRVHEGVEHRVTVLDGGFEYQGRRYRSLSAIARAITGTPWNGFTFFLGRAAGTRKTEEVAR